MGLGSTAKTLQTLADRAEQLYEQIKDLQRRTVKLEESVDESTERLRALEVEQEKQRVLLEAVAREHGVDVDAVLAEAAIEEAEPPESEAPADGEPTASDGTTEDGTGGQDAAATDDAEPTVVDESGQPVE